MYSIYFTTGNVVGSVDTRHVNSPTADYYYGNLCVS